MDLEDLRGVTRLLLASGADIAEINCIRKHLSRLQGGQAARLAAPSPVLVLALSDVIGDALDTIASGPFTADPTTFADAVSVIDKYDLSATVPPAVYRHLLRGCRGEIPETPKPGDPVFDGVVQTVCASNALAQKAALEKAAALGLAVERIEQPILGEAAVAAGQHCRRLEEIAHRNSRRPLCVVSGGETTVTLGPQAGRGGRNQEFALAAAACLSRMAGVTLLSAGTDGSDGPTDAAGAWVDPTTLPRCRRQCLDPERALLGHDAYPLFQALGDLLITGPTLTNVMDLQIAILE
jgi:hydroxypyruvate reductase